MNRVGARGRPRNGVDVTLNVAIPDALHRRFSLVCAVRGITIKDGTLEALQLFCAAGARELREALEAIENGNGKAESP